jgi:redox-sensitive bicupin YhaK (pirin superfamily)
MNTATNTQPRVTVRRSEDRGKTDIAWLDSKHTFSFGDYYDPEHMAFRTLRVINDDIVAPGMGFGTHPHRDMEILTWVISGELQHKDSMGNGRIIKAGELQYMSAGRGVTHSEFNPSRQDPVHLLQIWIIPSERGLTPSYAEWKPTGPVTEPLTLLASNDTSAGVQIHQDVKLWLGRLEAVTTAVYKAQPERGLWLQLISGKIEVGGEVLAPGDAAALEGVGEIAVNATEKSEFLLFDLA